MISCSTSSKNCLILNLCEYKEDVVGERKEKREVGREEEKMLSKSKDANHGRRGGQKMNKEERRDLWIKEMKVKRKETETIIIE